MTKKPLVLSGIYIHIPYCSQACYYCDFHFSTNLKTRKELIDCLSDEILLQKDFLPSKKLNTVYFGGGTPSILTKDEIGGIFKSIQDHFQVDLETEITLEANPDDLTLEQLKMFKSFGVNRLSIGIQSFENRLLKHFNRSHNALQAVDSVKNAQNTGINNISIDLIYGIPDQSLDDFKIDLQKAIDLNTPHISAYCLTIEENTVFGKWYKQKKLQPADETIAAKQFELLMKTLSAAGYQHYEISNFAKEGFKSRHNSSYWRQKPYLGIGPGAHSYNGNIRQYNVANNPAYIKHLQKKEVPSSLETLTDTQKINEYIITRIRTFEGIDLIELREKYGIDLIKQRASVISSFDSLIFLEKDHLKLSVNGKLFADKITEDLMF